MINFNEFKRGDFVVNCKTKEESKEFLKLCLANDLFFSKDVIDNSYNTYKEDVCYRCEKDSVLYGSKDFYSDDFAIVHFASTNSPLEILEKTPFAIVKCRNGEKYVRFLDRLLNDNGWLHLSEYDDDLYTLPTDEYDYENYRDDVFDIMEIYEVVKTEAYNLDRILVDKNIELIWKRETTKEMTLEEIEEALGYKVKLVE